MAQNVSQEELYKQQREQERQRRLRGDASGKSAPQPTFQSAPLSELVRASEAARLARLQPLPARRIVSSQGELVPVPPSVLALMRLQ